MFSSDAPPCCFPSVNDRGKKSVISVTFTAYRIDSCKVAKNVFCIPGKRTNYFQEIILDYEWIVSVAKAVLINQRAFIQTRIHNLP